MNLAGKPLNWWEASVVVLFGITVPVLPMTMAFVALWVGIEIARDNKRELTKRQRRFLNLGLAIVTFLSVTGKMPWLFTEPLEVGWASFIGFGIGMNGIVLFALFEKATYDLFRGRLPWSSRGPTDSAPPK